MYGIMLTAGIVLGAALVWARFPEQSGAIVASVVAGLVLLLVSHKKTDSKKGNHGDNRG